LNFDSKLFAFFKSLQSQSQILENSVIVFLGDHGDRLVGKSVTKFLERGLPALFIRLPTRIRAKYQMTLKENANRLTSAYDVHETFLHILTLENDNYNGFGKRNRTSLLLPVPLNRSCDTIGIYPTNCVCNVSSTVEPLINPYLKLRLIRFVTTKLNEIIQRSKYRRDCVTWTYDENGILLTKILAQYQAVLDVLVQVNLHPLDAGAHFETKVRIYRQDVRKRWKLLGNIRRISPYGNQSDCVGFKTAADKDMKAFCFCVNPVEIQQDLNSTDPLPLTLATLPLKKIRVSKRRRSRNRTLLHLLHKHDVPNLKG
jgi:hypothetical protein